MSVSPRWLLGVLWGCAVAAALWGVVLCHRFYHDDSYITLRYAHHLIHGYGPVWNPGERVEGYTNFLYMLAIAGLGATGIDLVTASRLVSGVVVLGLVVLLLAHAAGRAGQPGSAWASVPALLTLGSVPLLTWVFGGLEAPLLAALLTGGAVATLSALSPGAGWRAPALAGLAFGLAALTRLDSLLIAAVSGMALLASGWRAGRGPWPTLVFAAAFAALFLPHLVWRMAFYGELLPNTYYAKIDGLSSFARLKAGLGYMLAFAAHPPFLLPVCVGLALLAAWRRKLTAHGMYLLGIVSIHGAYVVWAGGDHMPAFRFFVPLVPVLGLLAYTLAAPLLDHVRPRALAWMTAAIGVALLSQPLAPGLTATAPDPAAYVGRLVGEYIAGAWPAGSLVALNTAGSTPYYAVEHRYIDMLGLNDRAIARRPIERFEARWQFVAGHSKGDGAYIFARRPDYIIGGPAEGRPVGPDWFLSELELSRIPDFTAEYELQQVRLDVSDYPGYDRFPATRAGTLTITYYRRVR